MLGTHDMVPWAGFVQGLDIDLREEAGHLNRAAAVRERLGRERALRNLAAFVSRWSLEEEAADAAPGQLGYQDGAAVGDEALATVTGLQGTSSAKGGTGLGLLIRKVPKILFAPLAYLSQSAAGLVIVGVDDLCLETRPHNLPGRAGDPTNWRRRQLTQLEAGVVGELSGHRDREDPFGDGIQRDLRPSSWKHSS